MTNADVIRQMTDDELYRFLGAFEVGDIDYALTFCTWCKEDKQLDCDTCFRRWLFGDANDYNGLLADKGINSGYAESKADTPQKDFPTEWCVHCELWREDNCIGVAQCKQNIKALKELSDLYEADTPQTDCGWK